MSQPSFETSLPVSNLIGQNMYIFSDFALWAHFSITEPSILEGRPAPLGIMSWTQFKRETEILTSILDGHGPGTTPLETRMTLDILSDLPSAIRGVFQLERGAAGTEHFQGYLEFASTGRKRFSWLKRNLFKDGQHFNRSRKPALANWRYCTKEESRISGPWNFGQVPQYLNELFQGMKMEILEIGGSCQRSRKP